MSRIGLKLDFDQIRERIDNEKEGLRPSEWAQKIGVRPNVVTNIHGKTKQKPSLEYIVAVSLATGRPVDYFLFGEASSAEIKDEVTRRHADLVTQFKNKREAYLGNCDLLEIEMVSEATFNRTIGYIKGVKETLVEASDKRNPKGLAVGKKAVNDK